MEIVPLKPGTKTRDCIEEQIKEKEVIKMKITDEEILDLTAMLEALVEIDQTHTDYALQLLEDTDCYTKLTRTQYHALSSCIDLMLKKHQEELTEFEKRLACVNPKHVTIRRKKHVALYHPDDVVITPAGNVVVIKPH